MRLPNLVFGRSERLLFPVALATCCVLGALLLGVVLSRESANEAESARASAAVQEAFDGMRSSIGLQARSDAERLSPEIIANGERAAAPLAAPTTHGAAWLVDLTRDFTAAGRPTVAGDLPSVLPALAPLAAGLADGGALRGGLGEGGAGSLWGAVQTQVVASSTGFQLAALTPYVGPARGARRPALLVLHKLDERALADLARAANTSRIEIAGDVDGPEFGHTPLLTTQDGRAYSLVWRKQQPGAEIVDRHAIFLLLFAAIFSALILVHARRVAGDAVKGEEEAKAQVGQDPLTGLPNRMLFERLVESEIGRVQRAVNERGAALLLMDVDRLKEFNDTYGEPAGDTLVVELTRRVAGVLRSAGRLARIDGDEFAIIQTDIVGPRDSEMLARAIMEAVSAPISIDGREAYASLSMGVALCPQDGLDFQELMRRAELALYRSKNEGRNRYCFFEEKLGEQLKMRKTVEDDLRAAIERDELQLLYQPVMEDTGKRMVGVEALVRWPHPAHGFISPENFITLAEECGLILPLGEWVLRRALLDLQLWPGLKIAVNVSGVQFRHPSFVPTLEKLLRETGAEPSRLELELTESILLADADSAEDAMVTVRAMGVRLALDDFGTGYSSLIYLRRFAFDKIKIDKSFLQTLEATGESAIIVHSIVHLGRALGLTVTAEGVETPDQHRFLQALGCHEMQGYLFSQPVPAAQISGLLARQAPDERRNVA